MINIEPVLFIHFAATCYMTLVIWYVQLIKYPQLNRIPESEFLGAHERYTKRMGYIAGPVMLIELLSGTLFSMLLIEVNMAPVHLNMGLLMLTWISTFAIQIPCHSKLSKGYDASVLRFLVRTNWFRTIVWTLRAVLLGRMLVSGIN